MVFSKLAFSRSFNACQPSSSVSSRQTAITSGRWLKKPRSSVLPEAASKSSRRATTGWASREVSACMGVCKSRGRLAPHAAQAGEDQLAAFGRREAGRGEGAAGGGRSGQRLAVVAAEQQVAGLAEEGQRAGLQFDGGA